MLKVEQGKQRGFTLIELLVALVVMLVGMMGAAGLLVRTVQQEVEAYQRLQALDLVQNMVDRMQANRLVVDCYSNGAEGISLGTSATLAGNYAEGVTGCESGATQSLNDRADEDLTAWHQLLLGSSVQNEDDDSIGAMIGARGCVTQINAAEQLYRVTVAWQGMSDSAAPPADNLCGKDQYGDEKRRRVVAAIVRIGDLT